MVDNTQALRFSRFNRLLKRENTHLLYNSLSNSFVELDKESYDKLSQMNSGDSVESLPHDLIELLIQIKGAVANDTYEIEKIKYVVLSNRYRRDVITLTINPTLSCNFCCPYCFEHTHSGATMTDEVEDNIVDFVKSHDSIKNLSVTWFGGEPLLAFNRIESLSNKLIALGHKYSAGMITNGYLFTEDIAKKLLSLCIRNIQITLDGLEKAHDSRRHLKNGAPTFNRILESLSILEKHAPLVKVTIRMNIDNNNAEDFIPLFEYFKRNFSNQVTVLPAFTGDSTNKGTSCIFDKHQQQSFLFSLFHEKGLNFLGFYPTAIRRECAVRGLGSYIIGPEGELYSCWNDVGNPEKIYGYINGKITNERELIKFKVCADALENHECTQCILFPVCNGGCPYERIKRMEQGMNPNDCPLIKTELDDYLWNHYIFKQRNKSTTAE